MPTVIKKQAFFSKKAKKGDKKSANRLFYG
jgi:hypothetical protein